METSPKQIGFSLLKNGRAILPTDVGVNLVKRCVYRELLPGRLRNAERFFHSELVGIRLHGLRIAQGFLPGRVAIDPLFIASIRDPVTANCQDAGFIRPLRHVVSSEIGVKIRGLDGQTARNDALEGHGGTGPRIHGSFGKQGIQIMICKAVIRAFHRRPAQPFRVVGNGDGGVILRCGLRLLSGSQSRRNTHRAKGRTNCQQQYQQQGYQKLSLHP